MKSLLSGFLVGATLGTVGGFWPQPLTKNSAEDSLSSWPQQFKIITNQLKQDVVPTVKEIQQSIAESKLQIDDDLKQIMNSANNLKTDLPKK